jgi:hypothetical protein
MKRPAPPPFVAPQSYRQRRLRDFARMLPVLGFALFLLPLLGSAERSTGGAGLWLFACWGALIFAAKLIAGGLSQGAAGEDAREPGR